MFRLVVLTIFVLGCSASQYQSILPLAKSVVQSNSYAAPAPLAYAAPVSYAKQSYGPVTAAVQTRRTIEFRNIDLQQELAQPQIIEVPENYETVQIHFRTASSPLSVSQSHTPAAVGPLEQASYQDNAQRLLSEVVKPVIQEVREVIQPYRRITQEIRPVIEEVHTVVHKGEKRVYQEPLPLKFAAPAYGAGAALFANKGAYRAAKA